METQQQLSKLNDEIVALAKYIRDKEAEWKQEASPEKAAVHLKSIERLNIEKTRVLDTRDRIIDAALAAAAAATPGKSTPLALDDGAPPLYANTQQPPLVVASLSSSTRHVQTLLRNSSFQNLVSKSRLRVRTRLVRPTCEEG